MAPAIGQQQRPLGRPYKKQAKRLLLVLFPQISSAAIHVVMQNANYSFKEAYGMLFVYQQHHDAGTTRFQMEGMQTVQHVFLNDQRPTTQQPLQLTDPTLIQEVHSMKAFDGLDEKSLGAKGVQIPAPQKPSTATASNQEVAIDLDDDNDESKTVIINIDDEDESTTNAAIIDVDAGPPTKRKRRRKKSAARPKLDLSNEEVVDLTDQHDVLPVGETECGVCFGDFDAADMVPCSGNDCHLVCQECLSRYVSEQVRRILPSFVPCMILRNSLFLINLRSIEECRSTGTTAWHSDALSPQIVRMDTRIVCLI